jgi:hypothetical protein
VWESNKKGAAGAFFDSCFARLFGGFDHDQRCFIGHRGVWLLLAGPPKPGCRFGWNDCGRHRRLNQDESALDQRLLKGDRRHGNSRCRRRGGFVALRKVDRNSLGRSDFARQRNWNGLDRQRDRLDCQRGRFGDNRQCFDWRRDCGNLLYNLGFALDWWNHDHHRFLTEWRDGVGCRFRDSSGNGAIRLVAPFAAAAATPATPAATGLLFNGTRAFLGCVRFGREAACRDLSDGSRLDRPVFDGFRLLARRAFLALAARATFLTLATGCARFFARGLLGNAFAAAGGSFLTLAGAFAGFLAPAAAGVPAAATAVTDRSALATAWAASFARRRPERFGSRWRCTRCRRLAEQRNDPCKDALS